MKLKDLPSLIIGNGIVLLMILFLCGAGLAILVSAAQSVYPGPFEFGDFIFKLVAGTLFGGLGLAILYWVYLREAAEDWFRRYRQNRYGDRPWMLKREWRKGRITYRAFSPAAFLWIFALGWNGGLGLVLTGNRIEILEAIRENRLNVLMVGLFVLIGLGVLYAAIRTTFTRNVSGWAVFTMDSVPGLIGGKLRGSIQTRIPSDSDKAVTLKLSSSPSDPLEQEVPRARITVAAGGLVIPVDFDIPDSCKGSNPWDPDHKVVWTLEARSRLDREAWEVSFVVPLFKIGNPEA